MEQHEARGKRLRSAAPSEPVFDTHEVFAGRRRDDEALVLQADRGVGPRFRPNAERFQAGAASRRGRPDRVLAAGRDEPLVADPSVADVDDPIGVLDRCGIVADEEGRRSLLADEFRDERENAARRLGVELAGGLVGDEEPRPMSERRAHRDSLLLPTGQLVRSCGEPVAEATRSSSSRARPSRFAAGAPASPSWTPTSSRAVSSPASARQ